MEQTSRILIKIFNQRGIAMKKLLIVTALTAILSVPSFAADKPADKEEDICKKWSELASSVMELRQKGVPMTALMATDNETIKKIVIDAYSEPRLSTSKYQKEAIDDFANKYALECYKSKNK